MKTINCCRDNLSASLWPVYQEMYHMKLTGMIFNLQIQDSLCFNLTKLFPLRSNEEQ